MGIPYFPMTLALTRQFLRQWHTDHTGGAVYKQRHKLCQNLNLIPKKKLFVNVLVSGTAVDVSSKATGKHNRLFSFKFYGSGQIPQL